MLIWRPRAAAPTPTLQRLLGADRELGNVDAEVSDAAVERAWGVCAPATWNRHVATARSFVAFCQRRGWLAGDLAVRAERRREPADRTRAIPYVQIERLWRREDVAVREKSLWRLLYETAARASEVLSLDVEDVDLENRRAVVHSKGGDIELLHFQTGSARLLPRLIAGRTRGPLFLTDRQPVPGRAAAIVDVCPVTDRARLSYRRAESGEAITSTDPTGDSSAWQSSHVNLRRRMSSMSCCLPSIAGRRCEGCPSAATNIQLTSRR